MEFREKVVSGSVTGEWYIDFITDTHIEGVGFHRMLFNQFLQMHEKSKRRFWIHGGDIMDADRPSLRERKALMFADRREALTHEDCKNMLFLDKYVAPRLERIKKTCLGMVDGDHYMIFKNGTTSTQYLCRKLGIPYLGERAGYARLKFVGNGNQQALYTILVRHGKGGGSNGADMNKLIAQNANFVADLYLGGHTHKENCHPQPLLYPAGNFTHLKQKVIWYVRGGSFLRGFMPNEVTYAELAEYGPLTTGWADITLRVKFDCELGKNLNVCATAATLRAS